MQPTVTSAAPIPTALSTSFPVSTRLRLDAIDFVRGLVMILMLLDHTRDFVHRGGIFADPLDPATTTPILYLTRWLTHLCAPTFVLLAGLGVGLRRIRGATAGDNAWFLFTRGLWLIVMELVVMRTIIWWNVEFWDFAAFLQVIWAIGVSMVLLSAVVRLPLAALGAIGAAIVLGHNLLDGIRVPFWFPGTPAPPPSLGEILWMAVHQSGFYQLGGPDGPVVFDRYPVLPWFGLLCVGYVLAEIYRWEAARRVRFLATSALVMLAAFVVLRGFNIYGDPRDWAPQPTLVQSAMALMNVEKYPPSLAYVLVTLLPALTLLAVLDGRTITGGLRGAVVTFGRVPFFFYILQWITAHVSGMVVTAITGRSIAPYFDHLLTLVTTQPQPDFGGPLWVVYLTWLLSLLAIYPLCRWFAGVKARRRDWYLSYL
jgi:uncharacterized membrane protein